MKKEFILNIKNINIILIIICLFFLFATSGCSVEKTNVFSKTYHNINARYNAWFIANEHMKDVEKAIDKSQRHNFNEILNVLPTIDTALISSKENELDQCFKKASLAIQRHNNSKWTDDCYILIGKTRFYQGKYAESIDFFKYVNVNSDDDNARHEALIQLMRTFVDMGEFNNAIYVSDYLKKEKLNKTNTKNLELHRAYLYQQRQDPDNMVKHLIKAAPLLSKKEGKARMYFILGQLFQEKGFDAEAYKYYNLCLKTNPEYELSFYSKLNMAQVTELSDGSDVKKVQKYFKSLLKDRKNEEFKDKIYYEMGEFEFKQENIEEALHLYKSSVSSSKNNPRQKAYAYLRLGELYFDPLKQYEISKSYYDSVVSTLPQNDERYAQIKSRQEVLADFVTQVNIIHDQDSLLTLSAMDSVQQMAFIDDYITKREQEEAERQKLLAKQGRKRGSSQVAGFNNASNSNWTISDGVSGSKWYFYNPSSVSIGRTEFTRQWGSRKLEDNWRRSNKESEDNFTELETPDQEVPNENNITDAAPQVPAALYDREELFNTIPKTAEEKESALKQIEEAHFKLGNIYNFNLDEKKDAAVTFEKLINRFPESHYKPETLYLLYLIYNGLEDFAKSDHFKTTLVNEHPNSIYAKLLINPNYREESAAVSEVLQKMYKEAYNYFQRDSLHRASLIINKGLTEYPDNAFADNLKLLQILIIGKTEGVYNYQFALQNFINQYPDSDLNAYARELLNAIDVHKINVQKREGVIFRQNPDQKHYFFVVYDQKDNIAERLIHRVNQFVKAYPDSELKTANMILDSKYSLILINEFVSIDEALNFYNEFNKDESILGDLKNYKINNFIITKENFETLYSTKGIDYYVTFFNKNYF